MQSPHTKFPPRYTELPRQRHSAHLQAFLEDRGGSCLCSFARYMPLPQAIAGAHMSCWRAGTLAAVMGCTLQHRHCRGSTSCFSARHPFINRCLTPYRNVASSHTRAASRRTCGARLQSKPQNVSADSPHRSQRTIKHCMEQAKCSFNIAGFLGICIQQVLGQHLQLNSTPSTRLLLLSSTSVPEQLIYTVMRTVTCRSRQSRVKLPL